MTDKVFFVSESLATLIQGALEWWIVFFKMLIEKMLLWKQQPAVAASQGIVNRSAMSLGLGGLG